MCLPIGERGNWICCDESDEESAYEGSTKKWMNKTRKYTEFDTIEESNSI